MQADTIKQLLTALGSGQFQQSKKWINARCPLAPWVHDGGKDKNPSFGVKINEAGESHCNCYTCGLGGDLFSMVHKVAHYNRQQGVVDVNVKLAMELVTQENELEGAEDIPDYENLHKAKAKEPEIVPFPEWWLDSFVSWSENKKSRHYVLYQRDLTKEIADKYDLRYDSYQDRLCFPVRTFDNILAGLHGRLLHEPGFIQTAGGESVQEARYWAYGYQGNRNPNVWYGEQCADVSHPLIVTEGNVDVLKLAAVYPNVIGVQGSNLSQSKLRRLRKAEQIITWFDFGKAGNKARAEFEKMLPHHALEHIVPSESEGDAGATEYEEIERVLDELMLL